MFVNSVVKSYSSSCVFYSAFENRCAQKVSFSVCCYIPYCFISLGRNLLCPLSNVESCSCDYAPQQARSLKPTKRFDQLGGSFILRAVYDKLLYHGPYALIGSTLFMFVPPHDIIFVMYQPVLFRESHADGHCPARPV